MPVLYKPFQSTLEDKKSGKKLFYPRVVRSGNVDSAQLSKEIAAYSSLSPGDVKNTLDNLVTVMGQHLQSSESRFLFSFILAGRNVRLDGNCLFCAVHQ